MDNSEYFDLTLASDEKDYNEEVVFSNYLIAEGNGDLLPINIDLNSPLSNPKQYLYWGDFFSSNTATSKNYYNPDKVDLDCLSGITSLCDVGLTMIDTGMYPYMTGQTLYYTMGIDEFMHKQLVKGKVNEPFIRQGLIMFSPLTNRSGF